MIKNNFLKIVFSTALMGLLLIGCGDKAIQNDKHEEIIVFAAASLREPLTELIHLYQTQNTHIVITASFDSSGILKTQIEEGADCDLFISAAQKQMNALEEKEFIIEKSRINLLENKVVLVAPQDNPANITNFTSLTKGYVKRIAIGNNDVPVGQYAEELMRHLEIWDVLNQQKKLTFGTNVKEIVLQVEQGAVDCGIVYETDAITADLPIVAYANAEWHTPVIYPAAIVRTTKRYESVDDFLQFITIEGADIFEKYGFSVIE